MTEADLLERVRDVVPLIAARAAAAEQQRKPDDDVIAALRETGVFRAFVPKRYGGYEIDLECFVDVGVTISEACPSTGWIATFYMEHKWLLGIFDTEIQDEIFTAQPYGSRRAP
jgi:alkylation response protein AidB-like acyl-CoA dehydrogenase